MFIQPMRKGDKLCSHTFQSMGSNTRCASCPCTPSRVSCNRATLNLPLLLRHLSVLFLVILTPCEPNLLFRSNERLNTFLLLARLERRYIPIELNEMDYHACNRDTCRGKPIGKSATS